MRKTNRTIALIILDGWGHSEQAQHNPILNTDTPTIDHLFSHYPHTLIQASGEAVGLPEGQMGNSEVGHLHIGAGRKIPQDLTRIRQDIQAGTFSKNPAFLQAIDIAKKTNKAIHVVGLLSPGGVHSHINQMARIIEVIGEHGIKQNFCHAFLDGRDVPPKSALASLQRINALYKKLPGGKIASIIGRYYAMDRDQRWQRTQAAYDCLTLGKADYHAADAQQALQLAYARNETDEFVKPTLIHADNEAATTINDGDIIIFMNFRSDRARQLTHAFTDPEFDNFPRDKCPKPASFITLTQYSKDILSKVAYPALPIKNTLGEFLSKQNYKQLRIAETEKYAHVTYFMNGGEETAYPNEDRILIPSPNVATYDLQPDMSALELTDQFTKAIESNAYDVIICNYANPDMIGHTGINAAAQQAIRTIDHCMQRVIDSLKKVNGEALITADHGNIEMMFDEQSQQPHTAHTCNPVPLLYIGRAANFTSDAGALDDVAPTLLYLLGTTPPEEMTGDNLLQLTD